MDEIPTIRMFALLTTELKHTCANKNIMDFSYQAKVWWRGSNEQIFDLMFRILTVSLDRYPSS